MITLRLDKNGGINKGDIKAFEHDNKSEVYIIQLYKNGAIYDLTNKSIELTMVERKRKIGDMVSLPIYEATEGKVKLEVVSDITKQDGIYDFKLTVKDTTGLIETFPSFQVKIENDITDSITGEIIQDPNFTILTEGLKALADYNIYKTNALKVPEIEQDIVEINEQLDNKAKKEEVQNVQQQVNNLVLGAVGDGNNAEVVQARGYEATLNDRLTKNENYFNELPVYKQTNLANINDAKQNTYWSRNTDNEELSLKNAGGYTTLPIIELKRGRKYYISNFFPNFTCVTKKSDKKVIITSFDSLNVSEPYVYTPSEDCYLYLTYTGVHNDIMVVENASQKPTEYLGFKEFKTYIDGFIYDYDKYGNKINKITVKKDSSGDCTTIAAALELCTNSSIDNQYEILIHDGEYNVIEELGGADYLKSIMSMDGAYAGLLLPDYVHLKGMGKIFDDVKITANVEEYSGLDFNVLDNAVTKLSPLNLEKNNSIENLTIIGQNCRYALHDESNNTYKDYIRKMKNVRIVHNGNLDKYTWRSTNGVGAGSGSGALYEYDSCIFEGSLPYSIHDNTGFTKGNKFKINNCRFIATQGNNIACRFVTVSLEDETIEHDVEMNNCQFVGLVGQYEEANGKGRKFYIHGGGNSVTPYIYTNTSSTAIAKPICFNEETQIMFNGENEIIRKGTIVKVQSGRIYKLTTSDKHLFYGIALEDIKSGENGHVKTKGYVYVNDTNFASFNVGDKIGISDGSLVVTTGNDYIGVTTDWNVMLLK